jgi:hypothetical protein
MSKYLLAIAAAVALCPILPAQQSEVKEVAITDSDIQVFRSDVQAGKNDIISHTMQFTDTESAAFWPVYRDYLHALQPIADRRVQLIKDYVSWADTIDDAKAEDLVKRSVSIDKDTAALREDYWSKFSKALGAKRAMKFYQVDNRLSLIVNLQLTANIPLIP